MARSPLSQWKTNIVPGLVFVLVTAGLSILLTMQGWKSRVPAFDMLTYIYDAHRFLETGALPRFGDIGSYGSYSPPGTAWLMVPGVVLFSDPRLPEYVGAGMLFVFSLLGLFLLAHRYYGAPCAYLAVLLYALSENALFYAGSLWPIGHPVFYIWMIYFSALWVERKQAGFLIAALVVWAAGMYVDMAILPAIAAVPVLWLSSLGSQQETKGPAERGAAVYFFIAPHFSVHASAKALRIGRPRFLDMLLVLLAGTAVLLLWLPYLQFEAQRGFIDIRSQLFQQSIFPASYRSTWCDPGLTLQAGSTAGDDSPAEGLQNILVRRENTSLINRIIRLWSEWADKLFSPFLSATSLQWAGVILLLLILAGILTLSAPVPPTEQPVFRQPWFILAVGMIVGGLLLGAAGWLSGYLENPKIFGPTAFALARKLRNLLLTGGAGLIASQVLLSAIGRVLERLRLPLQSSEQAERSRKLALSLAVPWWLLLVMAEPGKPERFLWLWSVQILFLAAFLANVYPRLRLPKLATWAGIVVVSVFIIGNSFFVDRVTAWARDGWAGSDAEEIQVVDSLSRQIQASGKDRAAIGYQLFIYPFMANYNITNPIYKVGAHLDLLLLYRHGIVNTNQCAEGFAPGDEYRVVEIKPKAPDWSPKAYFLTAPLDQLSLVDQVGSFQVYRR